MATELRRVSKDWEHPKDEQGRYIALLDGNTLAFRLKQWDIGAEKWAQGLIQDDLDPEKFVPYETKGKTYEELKGPRPNPAHYMPVWDPSELTHFMVYENTTEGTPISPRFESRDALEVWMVRNEGKIKKSIMPMTMGGFSRGPL